MNDIMIVLWLSCGAFCAFSAHAKKRDVVGWLILGAAFGLIALITLAGLPSARKPGMTELESRSKENEQVND